MVYIPTTEFFDTFTAKTTIVVYRSILKPFVAVIYGPGVDGDGLLARYVAELHLRDVKDDVFKYFASINDLAPKTVHMRLPCIKSFLQHFDVELPSKFWRDL